MLDLGEHQRGQAETQLKGAESNHVSATERAVRELICVLSQLVSPRPKFGTTNMSDSNKSAEDWQKLKRRLIGFAGRVRHIPSLLRK